MFKLHIYNPEHDIALGKNAVFFTPPKAARMTRDLYCHRPALWAEDGDWVLVDDIALAERNLREEKRPHAEIRFVTKDELRRLRQEELPCKIEPWGWDCYLVSQLLRCNPLFSSLVPSDKQLDVIRKFSSRQFVAEVVLPRILKTDDCFEGEMIICRTEEELSVAFSKNNGSIVVKSPWSCSGRGVRFLNDTINESERGWISNILAEQQIVLVEPQYNKVLDFAMEFYSNTDGVEFHGINIFETRNGAYLGNVEGSESDKLLMLERYVSLETINHLRDNIISITSELFSGKYVGPFGIDMMIIQTAQNETKVHPCVEMNLRRTMGQFT